MTARGNGRSRARREAGGGLWALLCAGMTGGHAALFASQHQVDFALVPLAAGPGLLLGYLLHKLTGPNRVFQEWVAARLSPLQTGFVLFFVYVVSSILLLSLVLSGPVGWMIERIWGTVDLATEYVVYSVNLIFVLTPLAWFQWWHRAHAARQP